MCVRALESRGAVFEGLFKEHGCAVLKELFDALTYCPSPSSQHAQATKKAAGGAKAKKFELTEEQKQEIREVRLLSSPNASPLSVLLR